MLSSRRQRCAHWVALLAIWMAALAPTLSAAFAHAGTLPGLEVCTTAGMQGLPGLRVDAAGAVSDPAGVAGGLLVDLDHCGYCLLVAHLAPPIAPLASPVPVSSGSSVQVSVSQPSATLPAWALQPSRAPPALY